MQFAVEDTLGDGVTWDSSKATCAVVLQANPLSGGKLVLHKIDVSLEEELAPLETHVNIC